MNLRYFLRETSSDVSAARLLGEYSAAVEIQLSATLAAGATEAAVFVFVSSPAQPGRTPWQAGAYTLTLEVVEADSVEYRARLYRANSAGAALGQIGTTPAVQTGVGTKTFAFTGVEIAAGKTDRLRLEILAANTDDSNETTLAVRCSASLLTTPITERAAVRRKQDRWRFIGKHPRPGEAQPDQDGFVETEEV